MRKEKVIYQDWIVALGHDPALTWIAAYSLDPGYNLEIISAVTGALNSLEAPEADFIRLFYLQGKSYRQISILTGRAMYRLESLHRIAVKKLKRYLYAALGGRYHIPAPGDPACPLCTHPRAEKINALIRSKAPEETWRRIIRVLRDTYDITLTTTQRLIGHYKYHQV